MDEPIVTPPDIQEALNDHKFWNSKPTKWARLTMEQFPHMRVVRLAIGDIFFGQKYRQTHYINYILWPDNSVHKLYSPDL